MGGENRLGSKNGVRDSNGSTKSNVTKAGRGRNSVKSTTASPKTRNRSKSSNRQNKDGNSRSNSRKRRQSGGKREEKKPVTVEDLDSAMDDYWMKSENKAVAEKKLDEDMDTYWEKKGVTTGDNNDIKVSENAEESNNDNQGEIKE